MHKRTFLTLLLLLATGLVALHARAHAADPMAALVTDARGAVEMNKGQGWAPAPLMTVVPQNAQIRVGAKGRATLSFARGGTVVTLAGPCTIQAGADGVKLVAGAAASIQAKQTQGRSTALLPGNVNMDRMGGGRVRAAAGPTSPSLALTIDPYVISTSPTISWYAKDRYDGYRVVLQDATTHKVVFEKDLPGTASEVPLPQGLLGWDKKYEVFFSARHGAETVRPKGTTDRPDPFRLTVVDEALVAELEKARTTAMAEFKKDPTNVSPLTLLLSNYLALDLYAPALEVSQVLSQQCPDDANLCRIMGFIYSQRFQTEKSKALYKKAGDPVSD